MRIYLYTRAIIIKQTILVRLYSCASRFATSQLRNALEHDQRKICENNLHKLHFSVLRTARSRYLNTMLNGATFDKRARKLNCRVNSEDYVRKHIAESFILTLYEIMVCTSLC